MKKIGLLLGSFDPVHIAHINVAACALNSRLCDEVQFVVAKHNPWKKNEPAPFDVRCKMIEMSTKPFHGTCKVCDLERDIEPPTYSYKVLDKIREQNPDDELYIIAGSDTIHRIPRWKNFETHIKDKVGFIEVTRGKEALELSYGSGNPFAVEYHTYEGLGQTAVILTHSMDVSSTMVRNLVADGHNTYPLITTEVAAIIHAHKLYENERK